MRKLRRTLAHNRLKALGYVKVNKGNKANPSFFSLHWREFIKPVEVKHTGKGRGAVKGA